MLAFGSEKGNIFLRQDWEELPKNFEPKDSGKDSKIMDLKFSSDGEFLIAAAVENSDQYTIFIFKQDNHSFFSTAPKMLRLDHETPINITFSDDNRSFVVITNIKSHYKCKEKVLICVRFFKLKFLSLRIGI